MPTVSFHGPFLILLHCLVIRNSRKDNSQYNLQFTVKMINTRLKQSGTTFLNHMHLCTYVSVPFKAIFGEIARLCPVYTPVPQLVI